MERTLQTPSSVRAQRLIQELLEQEATDYLGRERYERSGENSKGLRNGYKERHLKSAEGRIPVFLPSLGTPKRPIHRSSGNS